MRLKYLLPRLKKWNLVIRIIPILVVILVLKLIFHNFGWEIISLNALFTSLIAATTFLIGFLISGVISDYKESEKLPIDMAVSLNIIYNEIIILGKIKGNNLTKNYLAYYRNLLDSIASWFYREERTKNIIAKIDQMNTYIARFEGVMQPNFLSRIKNEQSNLYRMILRIDSIRDQSFIQSAYTVVEILAFFVVSGLLVLRIDPLYEGIFFTLVVSFLVIYMILLIKDLDNPFDYSRNGESGTEVSIKPLYDLIEKVSVSKVKLNKLNN